MQNLYREDSLRGEYSIEVMPHTRDTHSGDISLDSVKGAIVEEGSALRGTLL